MDHVLLMRGINHCMNLLSSTLRLRLKLFPQVGPNCSSGIVVALGLYSMGYYTMIIFNQATLITVWE